MTEHLPIQRWTKVFTRYPASEVLPNESGDYVTYNDHLAALRACEERVAEETEAAMMEFFHSKPSPPHDQHHFADNICAYCVGYQEAFTEAEKFYTNSCLFCGYAGEWSTWVCDDCKKEREEEDMGYISD